MKLLKAVGWRVMVYGGILFAYWQLTDNKYLQRTLLEEIPQPSQFSRPPDKYGPDLKKSHDEIANWALSNGGIIWAGFAKREITPPRFSWLAGFRSTRPALAIHDPLWVKSLALMDIHKNKAVIVSCDLIGLLPDEIQKIKALVRGIDPNNIFIVATHTHSSSDTLGLWGLWAIEDVLPVTTGKSQSYFRFLRQQIADAINESVVNMQNLKVGTLTVKSPAMADIRFSQGKLAGYTKGRAENLPDIDFSVMQVSVQWKTPVTIVNFACHPDVLRTLHISSDFVYFLEQKLKLLVGGEVMFLPRAIGGVEPVSRDAVFAKILGENLADAVWRSLKKPLVSEGLMRIKIQKRIIQAPLENTNFREAAKFGLISDLRGQDGLISGEVNRIQIGPAEILTVPGELFPKIWRQVEPLMKGQPKFIFGLTNGEYGYILPPEDFRSSKHRYHASMSVGPLFGTEIEKALKELATGR